MYIMRVRNSFDMTEVHQYIDFNKGTKMVKLSDQICLGPAGYKQLFREVYILYD